MGDTYIGHEFVDGFCVRCGEVVVVNTTDTVAEITEAVPAVENAETKQSLRDSLDYRRSCSGSYRCCYFR